MKSKTNILLSLVLFITLTSFDNLNKVKPTSSRVVHTQVNCRIIAKNTYNDCINHGFDVWEAINIAGTAYQSCMHITGQ